MSSSAPASCATGSVSSPSRIAARAIATASIASDLPRSRARLARAGHQLRRHPHDALAAREQEALQRARHVPAVLERPHALAVVEPTRPHQQILERAGAARAPSRRRATCAGRRHRPPPACASRLCVSAPITIICTVPSLGLTNGSPVDTSQSGRCHAPIRSRRRSSDGGGRHNHRRSDPGRHQAKGQPAAEPRTTARVGRHRPTR